MLRVAGVSTPLAELVTHARTHARTAAVCPAGAAGGLAGDQAEAAAIPNHDYAQIDPALACAPVEDTPPAPQAGLSYAGFTPAQRRAFLTWSLQPTTPAPPAFQQLLLATLELRLLESDDWAHKARRELLALAAAPTWQRHPGLARTLLLAFWLAQDGPALAAWGVTYPLTPAELTVALGLQALLGTPLRSDQLPHLLSTWLGATRSLAPSFLALRLDSLTAALGAEPLAHALHALGPSASQPRAWRCQHRDLRLLLPQPDLRPTLEPLLTDLLSVTEFTHEPAAADAAASESGVHGADAPAALAAAHIIVEFGHSRSEFFDYALRQARKQEGFAQLMDENRQIIYRVPFRRNEMRRFWQLWDSVQGWNTTRIFCAGHELEKWQVYPYSQYLR
jgi:hypothetical protein